MANTQHVDMLQEGVEVWNEWRKQNPAIRADLSGAMLQKTNLTGAILTDCRIYGISAWMCNYKEQNNKI